MTDPLTFESKEAWLAQINSNLDSLRNPYKEDDGEKQPREIFLEQMLEESETELSLRQVMDRLKSLESQLESLRKNDMEMCKIALPDDPRAQDEMSKELMKLYTLGIDSLDVDMTKMNRHEKWLKRCDEVLIKLAHLPLMGRNFDKEDKELNQLIKVFEQKLQDLGKAVASGGTGTGQQATTTTEKKAGSGVRGCRTTSAARKG